MNATRELALHELCQPQHTVTCRKVSCRCSHPGAEALSISALSSLGSADGAGETGRSGDIPASALCLLLRPISHALGKEALSSGISHARQTPRQGSARRPGETGG